MQSPSRSNNPHFYGRSISQSMTSLKKYCSSLTQICEGIRVACVITAAGWSSTHEKGQPEFKFVTPWYIRFWKTTENSGISNSNHALTLERTGFINLKELSSSTNAQARIDFVTATLLSTNVNSKNNNAILKHLNTNKIKVQSTFDNIAIAIKLEKQCSLSLFQFLDIW